MECNFLQSMDSILTYVPQNNKLVSVQAGLLFVLLDSNFKSDSFWQQKHLVCYLYNS